MFTTVFLALFIVITIYGVYNYHYPNAFSRFVEVQEDIDLDSYTGLWYDVYSLPVRFQDGLTNVTANYTLDNDSVIVYNQGFREDGSVDSIVGKARVIGDGRLKVSFFPLIWSDYNILFTDYNYAVVGGGSPNQLWILSRTPDIENNKLEELLSIAEEQGYRVVS